MSIKIRKKIVEMEAVQWTEGKEKEMIDFVGRYGFQKEKTFKLIGVNHQNTANYTDWIFKSGEERFNVISNPKFEKAFDKL